DMYAALDALIDKIDRQIKKHKEKLTDKHRGEKARSYPEP
ncbi:MAG: HPF/RaiA family ribosome-associated protein, partial [Candidatus Competibacter sp.]